MAKRKTSESVIKRANVAKRIEQPSPAFTQYYINDIQVMTTPWDLRLRMGTLENVDPEKGEATVMIHADVRLSPQHAKKLAEILTAQIAAYEAKVGQIPQPVEAGEEDIE